jgi:hypothetical protein
MGQRHPDFAPLDSRRANELEFIIDKAADESQAVVIKPGKGLEDAKPADLISPSANTNTLVRFGEHYC